jgi:hypothetical protein
MRRQDVGKKYFLFSSLSIPFSWDFPLPNIEGTQKTRLREWTGKCN